MVVSSSFSHRYRALCCINTKPSLCFYTSLERMSWSRDEMSNILNFWWPFSVTPARSRSGLSSTPVRAVRRVSAATPKLNCTPNRLAFSTTPKPDHIKALPIIGLNSPSAVRRGRASTTTKTRTLHQGPDIRRASNENPNAVTRKPSQKSQQNTHQHDNAKLSPPRRSRRASQLPAEEDDVCTLD